MTEVESQIGRQCIADLLDAGYAVSVNDGEGLVLRNSRDPEAIFAAMGTTDEDCLMASRDGKPFSFVRFIYGNDGWDVINDYGTSLELALARTNALVDRMAG